MQRRDFMKLATCSLASFILPARRRTFNLLDFCGDDWTCHKFKLSLPYSVDDWTYATDSRICVRARPILGDVAQHEGLVPPFGTLSWNHDQLTGWLSLPKLEPIMANDSYCLNCDGYGHLPKVPGEECAECAGTGDQWVGSNYRESRIIRCRACKGRGSIGPPNAVECPVCHGEAIGIFPSLVCLDGRYFDMKLYEKARALGGEYFHDNYCSVPGKSLLKFRAEEADGMLMALDAGRAKERISFAANYAGGVEPGTTLAGN